MFIRELTKDIRKPVNEVDVLGGLKWLGRTVMSGPAAAAQMALSPSSTSAWDTTDAPAMLYNKLRADGQTDADADRIARELRDRIQRGDTSSIETYQQIMGDGPLPWDLQDLQTTTNQRIATGGGRGDGNTELAQRRADAASGTPGAGAPPQADTPVPDMVVAPKIGDAPVETPPKSSTPNTTKATPKASTPNTTKATPKPKTDIPSSVSTLPNVVKDAGAAQSLAQSNPQTASQWADGISKATGGSLGSATVNSMAQTAMKYALPAAAVVALLYGGKKLIDYLKKDKKKESIGEEATAGATSAGNIASVANPKAAYFKPKKRGKYGAPQAPQEKEPNGTAKPAHKIKNASLFGGKVAKR